MNLSLIDLFNSMGWFAKGIAAVLLIMSIFSLTIMIQKWWSLRAAQKRDAASSLPSSRSFWKRTTWVTRSGWPRPTRSRTSRACSVARWARSSR